MTLRLLLCCAWVLVGAGARADDLGFAVPEGFEVSLFADDDLATDIFAMTVDSRGRVAVAGRNYVKLLHDDDGDGRADRATLFSSLPASGAHGLLFDGNNLIATGDDSVLRLPDADGDGRADGPPVVLARLRHPEHGANGIVHGPDGWYYVICGNDAQVTPEHAATPASPVKRPNCGAVVRISPDGAQSEIVADGFRNPYAMDIDARGHLFTVDADGERDQYLPWYAPNRLFDIAQGMHHGWLLTGWTRSWNRPVSHGDNVERLVEIGRGSPTGVVVYRHRALPERYRGGVFSACWTLGVVYFFPLERHGSTYRSRAEVFMRTTGQVGFAPTSLAVGPEGELFVSIGGRGTRGGVFRVRYAKAERPNRDEPPPDRDEPLLAVLDADQPFAAWSRARWMPIARQLGAAALVEACERFADNEPRVLRAIEVLTELYGGVPLSAATRLAKHPNPEVRARLAWSIGRARPGDGAQAPGWFDLARRLAQDESPLVARFGLESWSTMDWIFSDDESAAWLDRLGHADRRVRAAAVKLASETASHSPRLHEAQRALLDRARRGAAPGTLDEARRDLSLLQTLRRLDRLGDDRGPIGAAGRPIEPAPGGKPGDGPEATDASEQNWRGLWVQHAALIARTFDDPAVRVQAVRLMQVACGDLRVEPTQPEAYAGYVSRRPEAISAPMRGHIAALGRLLPTSDAQVNGELARLLAMVADPEPGQTSDAGLAMLLDAVLDCPAADGEPMDDIHFLIVLSRLPGQRTPRQTERTADRLVLLHHKMAQRDYVPSRNWPALVGELFDELCRRDERLAAAVVDHPRFALAEHGGLALRLKGELAQPAARKLVAAAQDENNPRDWTSELVLVAALLPDEEIRPLLRELWQDQYAVRDDVALVLARNPQSDDRGVFVQSLGSAQANVVAAAARALSRLDAPGSPREIGAALVALRQYCSAADRHADLRRALAALLVHWTAQNITVDERQQQDLQAAYRPWFDWFAKAHPDEARRMSALGGDLAAWRERLAGVDWYQGDAARGREVFERRACQRCHQGSGRLGPDLKNIAVRFSRDDLLAKLIDPNRSVSPLYQTTQVTTRSGQTYSGILIYESPESSLLQIGPDSTIRITDEDVSKRRPSNQSLMPTGLLDGLSDRELADLYRYLQTR